MSNHNIREGFIEDILTRHQNVMELCQHDPRVLSVEMVPDDNHGTVWYIHLRNGDTVWSGAGIFETATRCRDGHYRVRPQARVSIYPMHVEEPIPLATVDDWIRRRHPEINEWSSGMDMHWVLYGLVQAGKTELILSMIWISQYVYDTQCVLVLANMTASYNQVLGKNAVEFNEMMREEFGERVAPFFLKTTGFRGRSVDINHDHTWLRVAMGNPAQLRRLVNTISGRFILFSDEADVHVKGWNDDSDMTSTGPLMKQLQGMAVGSVKITATPFALYNQYGAHQRTLVMNKPDNYRGLLETEWVFSTNTDAKVVRQGNAPKAVQMLDEMVGVLRPRVESDRSKYLTILVNGPATIARQNALAQAIARSRPQWCAYVMNSDGGNSSIKQAMRTRMMPTGMETISSLYDKFERDNNDEFQVNIIVACLTASRAISFRPSSRRVGTGGLHGMIFFPSATCHAAQLIQFMRVWGKFDDDYPQVRVRTTQIAYDKLYSEITHNLKAFAEITSETGLSREQIEGVHLIDVGLHDRRAVDDTNIEDKVSMLKREFETEDDVRNFLAVDYNQFIVLTNQEVVQIPSSVVPNFTHNMVGNSHQARIIRSQIVDILPPNVPRNSIQICWNDARYDKLHHIPSRMTPSGEYNSKVVVGLSSLYDIINIVIWNDDFRDLLVSDLREDTAYLFRTTKGGWRYFTRNEKRRVGTLSH